MGSRIAMLVLGSLVFWTHAHSSRVDMNGKSGAVSDTAIVQPFSSNIFRKWYWAILNPILHDESLTQVLVPHYFFHARFVLPLS